MPSASPYAPAPMHPPTGPDSISAMGSLSVRSTDSTPPLEPIM